MKSLQALINKHGDQEISEEKFIETFGIEVKKRWKPDGGLYWYVDSDGVVCYTYWSNRLGDRRRWLLGNVYETEEEAEFARDKKRFLTKMERDFEDNSEPIDWKNQDQEKWSFQFNYHEQEIVLYIGQVVQTSDFATTDGMWLEEYVEANEHDIKKYLFGVETQNSGVE